MFGLLKKIRELQRQNKALVSIIADLRECIDELSSDLSDERRRRINLAEDYTNYKREHSVSTPTIQRVLKP